VSGPCDCFACTSGAGKCSRKLTDDEMLDQLGYDRRGRTRPIGKGPELRERLPHVLEAPKRER